MNQNFESGSKSYSKKENFAVSRNLLKEYKLGSENHQLTPYCMRINNVRSRFLMFIYVYNPVFISSFNKILYAGQIFTLFSLVTDQT